MCLLISVISQRQPHCLFISSPSSFTSHDLSTSSPQYLPHHFLLLVQTLTHLLQFFVEVIEFVSNLFFSMTSIVVDLVRCILLHLQASQTLLEKVSNIIYPNLFPIIHYLYPIKYLLTQFPALLSLLLITRPSLI